MQPISDQIIVFTDGAAKGNPGSGGYGVIIVLPTARVTELGNYVGQTTNNRMELSAAITAFKFLVDQNGPLSIYTDSKYLINGITKWVFGWKKNNWKTKEKKDVLNKDLWLELSDLVDRRKKDQKIDWHYVSGHTGILGNERCDEIASNLAEKKEVKLFDGRLSDYKIDILNFSQPSIVSELEKSKKNNISNKKAYVYLSLINDVLYRDTSWVDCEKRVRGVKGAKYRKALSSEHEKEILKTWNK